MVPLAKTNKYLKSRPLMKLVRENASTSTAYERVPAKVRGGAIVYKVSRSLTASSKKRAK
jgi:hypothetical protein